MLRQNASSSILLMRGYIRVLKHREYETWSVCRAYHIYIQEYVYKSLMESSSRGSLIIFMWWNALLNIQWVTILFFPLILSLHILLRKAFFVSSFFPSLNSSRRLFCVQAVIKIYSLCCNFLDSFIRCINTELLRRKCLGKVQIQL